MSERVGFFALFKPTLTPASAFLAAMINLRRYMETHWQYYIVKVVGGSHDGRWLQPMLRESTPQWSDDNGETLVHLYCGNLPATASDSYKSWWLLEAKSPSAAGDVWWKVLARRDSFLEGPGHQQLLWDPTAGAERVGTTVAGHQQMQWTRTEGAESTVATVTIHENEYPAVVISCVPTSYADTCAACVICAPTNFDPDRFRTQLI